MRRRSKRRGKFFFFFPLREIEKEREIE